MKLHILGRNSGGPGPGGACSGYLVQSGNGNILLDCGPGIIGRLQQIIPIDDLDAIIITHLHADHFLDLIPLAYLLMDKCFSSANNSKLLQIPVFIPQGTRLVIESISRALGHYNFIFPTIPSSSRCYQDFLSLHEKYDDFVFALLSCNEYSLDGNLDLLGLEIKMQSVNHRVPTSAIRIEENGKSLVYSGDSAYCPPLIKLARNTDVFLCEATNTPSSAIIYPNHMSPYEAGTIAKEANAGELILTHLSPWVDANWVLEEAQKVYKGKVIIAIEGETHDIK